MVEFIVMDFAIHREDIIMLNIEYMNWIYDEIESKLKIDARAEVGAVDDYIKSKIDEIYSFNPPEGLCYLLREDNHYAGMGAFRKLREGVVEIKRMYVKPEYRGRGFGKELIQRLLEQIETYNYNTVLLDTAPFMTAAHGLYRKMGFKDREAFPESEIPERFRHLWTYMEKQLE